MEDHTPEYKQWLEKMKMIENKNGEITKKDIIKTIIPLTYNTKEEKIYLYLLFNDYYKKPKWTKEDMENIKETFTNILKYYVDNKITDSINYEFCLNKIVNFLNIDILIPFDELTNKEKQRERDEMWNNIEFYLKEKNEMEEPKQLNKNDETSSDFEYDDIDFLL